MNDKEKEELEQKFSKSRQIQTAEIIAREKQKQKKVVSEKEKEVKDENNEKVEEILKKSRRIQAAEIIAREKQRQKDIAKLEQEKNAKKRKQSFIKM